VERTFTIRQGEKDREIAVDLAATDTAAEPSARPPLASWVLGGIGVVGLASFTYFGLKGLGGRSDLADCKGECAQSDVDAVHADFTRADVSLAISALAFGGALYFYFSAPGVEGPERAAVGVVPRRGGAETSLRVAF
jgi:hypothetical protein